VLLVLFVIVTDLEKHNGVILHYFTDFVSFGANYVTRLKLDS